MCNFYYTYLLNTFHLLRLDLIKWLKIWNLSLSSEEKKKFYFTEKYLKFSPYLLNIFHLSRLDLIKWLKIWNLSLSSEEKKLVLFHRKILEIFHIFNKYFSSFTFRFNQVVKNLKPFFKFRRKKISFISQ